MAAEGAEKKIYDAATIGDVATLYQLLQQYPYLLHEVSFAHSRNLLHIAAMLGETTIVEEVLKINPRLARSSDSQKSSPLHIAVEEGNLEITKRLLLVAPEICWWRDDQGMNPVHVAAVKGHVMILAEMLQLDLSPAREKVHRGQTALHLCVKHRQIETLKVLVDKLGDQVYEKDDDGETLLHLAVRSNQLEIVRYLVKSIKTKKLVKNCRGKTALGILDESFGDTSTYLEMRSILCRFSSQSMSEVLPKLSDTTMVVVVLIATMAFQAVVSPPGGVWQEGKSDKVGKAVMATSHPTEYKYFICATHTAFALSIITIFLISTGLTQENSFFMVIATNAMFISVISIAVSYGASVIMTDPTETKSAHDILKLVAYGFLIIYFSVVGYLSIRKLVYWSHRRMRRRRQDLTTAPDCFPIRALVSTLTRINIWLEYCMSAP